ncbi:MAG: sulfite exporter TauE/SafE family protein [Chloroflexi bacterium]|nr:sulfite exporter TauE/SafE family protein [Chloroflexota bacterium]
MLTTLALMAVGAVAGVLGALLGIGGGIFLVPALTILFDIPIRAAVGASLMGVITTSAGVAWLAHGKRGADISLALRLELATTSGAIAGGLVAGLIQPKALFFVFAFMAIALAVFTAYRARRQVGASDQELLYRTDYTPRAWPAGLSFSFVAGSLSGLLGVGGGFIQVPVMYSMMGIPLGIATATSNFTVGITGAASFFVYLGRGDIYPLVAVPTAIGVFIGALSGAKIAPRLRASWLRTALILLLFFMGAQMLWKGLGL